MRRSALGHLAATSPSSWRRSPQKLEGESILASSRLHRELQTGVSELPEIPDWGPSQLETLYRYCELLRKWSRTYNLVGVRTLPQMVPLHILDALALSPLLPPRARRFLDLGTGAGLPGFPLAIALPRRRFTLLDRNSKRARFLRIALLELQLENVEVVRKEVEQFKAEPFDCIMARAVSAPTNITRICAHLIKPTTHLLLPQGPNCKDAPPQGWDVQRRSVKVPGHPHPTRTILLLRQPPDPS